jgi:hypothetical protein
VENGIFNETGIVFGYQDGFVATDAPTTASNVFVTSSIDGVLAAYDKLTLTVRKSILSSDLRSLAIQDNQIAVLDGGKGVSIYDQNFQLLKEIAINGDFGVSTKRTVDFDQDRIIVSEGSKGVGIYNATSGAFIEYIPILINPDGVATEDIVNNAVAINEGGVLMANGGAGLSLNERKIDNTEEFGIIGLEGSINFVESNADLLVYRDNGKMKIEVGEELAYFGGPGKRLKSVEVKGSLLLCVSWTVQNDTWVMEDALFEMKGSYIIGSNKKQKELLIEKNATFRVEGNLTIYGDLILVEGATIAFLNNAVVTIFGDVDLGDGAQVIGDFEDVRNAF